MLRARRVECEREDYPTRQGRSPPSYLPLLYIAQANQEVQKAISSDKQKLGLYKKYNAGLCADISKYASYHVALVHRRVRHQ